MEEDVEEEDDEEWWSLRGRSELEDELPRFRSFSRSLDELELFDDELPLELDRSLLDELELPLPVPDELCL